MNYLTRDHNADNKKLCLKTRPVSSYKTAAKQASPFNAPTNSPATNSGLAELANQAWLSNIVT
jgi:hypothetical protein